MVIVDHSLYNIQYRFQEVQADLIRLSSVFLCLCSAPVILDPNTAHGSLKLSRGLTSIAYTDDWSKLPDNSERFDDWANVLGSEGFKSGAHCWDVQVGANRDWDLGVVTESAKRKGDIDDGTGVWYMVHKDGNYFTVSSPQTESLLTVIQKPQRIRVVLDWDRGKVSLFDLDNNTHLHTFTHPFTERVFPFFGSQCELFPLRILPLKTSVRVHQ